MHTRRRILFAFALPAPVLVAIAWFLLVHPDADPEGLFFLGIAIAGLPHLLLLIPGLVWGRRQPVARLRVAAWIYPLAMGLLVVGLQVAQDLAEGRDPFGTLGGVIFVALLATLAGYLYVGLLTLVVPDVG